MRDSFGPRTNDPGSRAAFADFDRRLRHLEDNDMLIEGGRRLVLRSPNGHFWSVGVDDTGALTTTDMGTTL